MKVLVLAAAVLASSALSAADNVRTWDFDVLLDDSRIGTHRFEVVQVDDGFTVTSAAQFDVRFLFVTAFRYRHLNTEVWRGSCLESIDSRTRMNRKQLEVSGERIESGLFVDDGQQRNRIGDCVMTFAYWNPEFLRQPQLLNPQDGRYLDVTVDELPEQRIVVRGVPTEARVYRVNADKLQVTVWYSDNDEWLALESVAKGGRIIRYELT